jgi:acyl-CoA thioester hydrolase
MFVHETKIRVRYVETDKMGIVHHSNYYIWFEAARDEFIDTLGISYSQMEEKGIMMPLIETHCKYKEAARYGAVVTIKTFIKELSGAKIVLNYEVIDSNSNKLLATGSTTQAFVNSEGFKIINLKRKYPELYKKFEGLI